MNSPLNSLEKSDLKRKSNLEFNKNEQTNASDIAYWITVACIDHTSLPPTFLLSEAVWLFQAMQKQNVVWSDRKLADQLIFCSDLKLLSVFLHGRLWTFSHDLNFSSFSVVGLTYFQMIWVFLSFRLSRFCYFWSFEHVWAFAFIDLLQLDRIYLLMTWFSWTFAPVLHIINSFRSELVKMKLTDVSE